MKTIIKTNSTLEKLIYNLPIFIFSIIVIIRLLVAIPLTIVSINKFAFLDNTFIQYLLGIGAIITLELVLTVLSLLTAEFRRKISDTWANSVLVLVVLLTIYTSYLIQSLSQMYDIQYGFSVFLTLHILNIVSILLSESIGFLLKKADEMLLQNSNSNLTIPDFKKTESLHEVSSQNSDKTESDSLLTYENCKSNTNKTESEIIDTLIKLAQIKNSLYGAKRGSNKELVNQLEVTYNSLKSKLGLNGELEMKYELL